MSSTVAIDEDGNAFSDLLDELGGISPARIIRRPFPGTATEEDVIKLLEAPRKRICELIDGVLVEKPPGFRESVLGAAIVSSLLSYVKPRNLGMVAGADGTIRLWPGRVRIPDVAYISWDRLPGSRIPDEPIPEVAPNIVVEVLSESNTKKEMEIKRSEYFRVGVQRVWEIDPEERTVAVYTSPTDFKLLTQSETLDGGAVLPGYSLLLTELFEELDQHG